MQEMMSAALSPVLMAYKSDAAFPDVVAFPTFVKVLPIVSVTLVGKLPLPERHSARRRFVEETFNVSWVTLAPEPVSPVPVELMKVMPTGVLVPVVVPDVDVDRALVFPAPS